MAKAKREQKMPETRKTEVRYKTNDPGQMLGKYLVNNLYRTWVEEFIDEDTEEKVDIERREYVYGRGTLINEEVLSRICFHLEAGDISEVEVSNQRREAYLSYRNDFWPFSVTAVIDGKSRRFLLYAQSVLNAIEITQDYIELNFTGHFIFTQVKANEHCFFLKDSLTKKPESATEPDKKERNFYKIEVEVMIEEMPNTYRFLLQTKDVNSGMIVINNWLSTRIKEERKKAGLNPDVEYTTTVTTGQPFACYRMIDEEFSNAYLTAENK